MNKFRAVLTWWRWVIVTWWHWVTLSVAVTVFLIAFFTPSTDKDPAGIAGLSASLVALCAASMILSEAVHAGGLQIRRLPSIFIGICGMASAYL